MEDIIELYLQPPDPKRPLICLDEAAKELQADVVGPLPAQPGRLARQDYEYERHGSSPFFLTCAPQLGWRRLTVTPRRTVTEFAQIIKQLVDEDFPDAERILLVMDNLNTHTAGALYATFPAATARRLWAKLEVHYTPKHGSWLNMAELELSVLARQCLNRRIPDRETLQRVLTAWATTRNQTATPINWRFTTTDARSRLKHVYPVIESGQS
jgi:hypothetical protein